MSRKRPQSLFLNQNAGWEPRPTSLAQAETSELNSSSAFIANPFPQHPVQHTAASLENATDLMRPPPIHPAIQQALMPGAEGSNGIPPWFSLTEQDFDAFFDTNPEDEFDPAQPQIYPSQVQTYPAQSHSQMIAGGSDEFDQPDNTPIFMNTGSDTDSGVYPPRQAQPQFTIYPGNVTSSETQPGSVVYNEYDETPAQPEQSMPPTQPDEIDEKVQVQKGIKIFPSYPRKEEAIPLDASLEECAQHYPNHLTGEGMDKFIQHRWTASNIWDICPQHLFRAPPDPAKTTKEQLWNTFQKRLDARKKFLGVAGIDALDAEPEFRRRCLSSRDVGRSKAKSSLTKLGKGRRTGKGCENDMTAVNPAGISSAIETNLMIAREAGFARSRTHTPNAWTSQYDPSTTGIAVQTHSYIPSAIPSNSHLANPQAQAAYGNNNSTSSFIPTAQIPGLSTNNARNMQSSAPKTQGQAPKAKKSRHLFNGVHQSHDTVLDPPIRKSAQDILSGPAQGRHVGLTQYQSSEAILRESRAEFEIQRIRSATGREPTRPKKRAFDEVEDDQQERAQKRSRISSAHPSNLNHKPATKIRPDASAPSDTCGRSSAMYIEQNNYSRPQANTGRTQYASENGVENDLLQNAGDDAVRGAKSSAHTMPRNGKRPASRKMLEERTTQRAQRRHIREPVPPVDHQKLLSDPNTSSSQYPDMANDVHLHGKPYDPTAGFLTNVALQQAWSLNNNSASISSSNRVSSLTEEGPNGLYQPSNNRKRTRESDIFDDGTSTVQEPTTKRACTSQANVKTPRNFAYSQTTKTPSATNDVVGLEPAAIAVGAEPINKIPGKDVSPPMVSLAPLTTPEEDISNVIDPRLLQDFNQGGHTMPAENELPVDDSHGPHDLNADTENFQTDDNFDPLLGLLDLDTGEFIDGNKAWWNYDNDDDNL